MVQTITRGDSVVVRTTPKDPDGNVTSPLRVDLFLNYIHSDGTASTDDPPLSMLQDTLSGQWSASFETKDMLPGSLFGSIRAIAPSAADDFKCKIAANAANPPPPGPS